MEQTININPEVLKWTRLSLNIDLSKASKLSKIPEDLIKQFESGKKPNLIELNALAKAYQKSLASLLLYNPPKEKPLPKDRRTVNSDQLNIFDPKTIQVVQKSRALFYSIVELKEELGFEIKNFSYSASLNQDPSSIAQYFRNEWCFDEMSKFSSTDVALESYIEKMENLGITIFQMALTKDKLRGFSIIDERAPIIVIKRGSEPATAKIFTLFHEVGHILLKDDGICDIVYNNKQQEIEKWCNAFAAELLVPIEELLENDIVKKYTNARIIEWSKTDLIKIGASFFVGPLVILRRLYENKLTTQKYYEEKHGQWNKPQFGRAKEPKGRDIPKELIKERGKTFIGLAFTAYEKNKINLKELSDYLGAKLTYIPKIRKYLYEY